MFRNKTIVFALSAIACMATAAYCQERVENRQILTISGRLAKVDFVGSTIVVKKDNEQITLSVQDDAIITEGTEKLGLEDLEENDPVTIQYYSPYPGQYDVVSIVDNNIIVE
jgi:preprotein translocase subunit YajC